MPVHSGKDKGGCFYQWGEQAKYYYKCDDKEAGEKARKKAAAQGYAIEKESGNYSNSCKFSASLYNENESEISDWFVILEHKEKDDYIYKNGIFEFNLNAKELKNIVKNFNNGSFGRELYINYDHESNGSTKAAGWIKEVRFKDNRLEAKAEWTANAKKSIEDKEYKYFSCEMQIAGMKANFFGDIIDLKIKSSALTGGALTNNPFFKTTNLSLSEGENNMPDSAELNAEFEQFKLDTNVKLSDMTKVIEEQKAVIASLTAENEALKAEKVKFAEEQKVSVVDIMLSEVKFDEELEKIVREKILKFAKKADDIAEVKEFAADVIKANDNRKKVDNVDLSQFKHEDEPKALSPAEWQAFMDSLKK